MPKSNRSKKGAAKAGLTRNQAFKANRSAQQAERLRAAIQFGLDRQNRKESETNKETHRKIRRPSMRNSAQRRRHNAMLRLQAQLADVKDDALRKPIEKQIATLKARIKINLK